MPSLCRNEPTDLSGFYMIETLALYRFKKFKFECLFPEREEERKKGILKKQTINQKKCFHLMI